MKLAEVSVRRPVFAIMMTAALIVLGAVSYDDLGLDLMPKTDSPDRQRAGPACRARAPRRSRRRSPSAIEEAVNTISGIDELRAHLRTRATRSVTITFTLERDIESATQDVRDKVAHDRQPVPARHAAAADHQDRSRRAADPQLRRLRPARRRRRSPRSPTSRSSRCSRRSRTSARSASTASASARSSCCSNADRLNAYGLTVDQVRTAVERQNVEIPGGSFIAGPSEVALRTMGRITNVEDFNRIVISYRDDGSVDHVRATSAGCRTPSQEVRSATRLNGTPADRRPGPQAVGHQHRRGRRPRPGAAASASRRTLPPDIQISIGNDQSRFIRRSFEDIQLHLILGGLLASVVVFLFIRNLRVTFIAALAIPTSIIGTFTVMKIARLHAEQHDDAGAVAGDRHRHRRRDRRAREHLPVRRGERA